MRALSILIGTITLIGFAGPIVGADPDKSGYAGQESRSIKALSQEDIAALRKGEGMGMAKAAELNGYPGPLHVLALARDLRLAETQVSQVTAIRDRMSNVALPLGAELIERERLLDRLFAQSRIMPEQLTAETAAIGEIQGRLRGSPCSALGNACDPEPRTSGAIQKAPRLNGNCASPTDTRRRHAAG